MAGRIIPIIPKTTYNQVVEQDAIIPLNGGPRSILTTDWRSGVLSVCIYDASLWNANMTICVKNVFIPPDDPSALFSDSTYNIATIRFDPSNLLPGIYSAELEQPMGPMIAVFPTIYSPATIAMTCTWTMSIDLIGRDILEPTPTTGPRALTSIGPAIGPNEPNQFPKQASRIPLRLREQTAPAGG